MVRLPDIVGHEETIHQLQRAFSTRRAAHAYLFQGPEGVGKASVAVAWLQTFFCRDPDAWGEGIVGCGRCPPCVRISSGTHPDLLSVTMEAGKTRISVDQVRDLIRFISLTPMESIWKAVMMDDAALMNEQAASALLKTLEEPPAHSIIILITSRPGTLLPTIHSRCQRTRFASLNEAQVAEVIARHSKEDAQAVAEAARLSGGGVARGLSFCDGSLPRLRARLGEELSRLPTMSLAELSDTALGWSGEEFALGGELLAAWLRETIRDRVAAQPEGEVSALSEMIETALWLDDLLRRVRIFNLNRQMVMEAVLIRLGRLLRGPSFA